MGKLGNITDNIVTIPSRTLHTIGQGGIDIINTLDGLPKDLTSVILSTKNKIADLFSKDLERYKYIGNAPVAVGVGLAGAVEAVVKPIANGLRNIGKTVVNFGSNARKSIIWNGIIKSGRPVSDISFNTIKTKAKTFKIDTTEDLRDRDSLLTDNWGFLTKAKKIELYKKKLRDLGAAA